MRNLRGVGAPLIKFLIFAVVTIMCTVLLAGTIANHIGGDTVEYKARFSDATSLVKGDDVRIAGVRVGEVRDIKLVDRNVALVTIAVEQAIQLPKSVQATIKYRDLIGRRFIALDRGAGPPAGSTAPLNENDTIPITQTHPAVNLTQLFDGFRPLFQALTPPEINQLSFELVQVLQGEGGTVTSLLAHTASLTSTIADKDAVIGQVINNLNTVLDTVNNRDSEFTELVVTVRQLVSGLAKDRNTIGEAIDSIGEATDATADLLHDARPPLRDDIQHLGLLARTLNNNPATERFIKYLPRKLDILTPLGTYASWFNFYLCDVSIKVTVPQILPDPLQTILAPYLGQSITLPIPPGLIGSDKRCTSATNPPEFPAGQKTGVPIIPGGPAAETKKPAPTQKTLLNLFGLGGN
jgi:phospholipid/cholesterol/gamma-HCH transport system substrate-binding protein